MNTHLDEVHPRGDDELEAMSRGFMQDVPAVLFEHSPALVLSHLGDREDRHADSGVLEGGLPQALVRGRPHDIKFAFVRQLTSVGGYVSHSLFSDLLTL